MSNEPMMPTAEDYVATLASMVLIRSGCDTLPVDSLNLLRHVASVRRSGDAISISKDENGYTACIPAKIPLGRRLCAELLLSILLDRLGYTCNEEREKNRFQFVFTCHLLCPRPVFRLADRVWASVAFLEDYLGIPRSLVRSLPGCPSCYVPSEMNIRLLSQFRPHYHSLHIEDRTNEVAMKLFLRGYEDDEYRLTDRPEIKTGRLQEAVDALVPEHVLTKGHPASLYIEYSEDFSRFSGQFASIDMETLYRLVFGADPPLPLFGGMPEKGSRDYAIKADRYLSRESSARLAMANLLYQRKYRPDEADILSASIRKLYETT